MAQKKSSTQKTRKSKKVQEPEEFEHSDVEDVELDEEEEEPVRKSSKKRKTKKEPSEQELEDELSDIDIEPTEPKESSENDHVTKTKQNNKRPRNKPRQREPIDPERKLKDVTLLEHLEYLIQVGTESCNPTLRFGIISLKNELRGIKPRQYGSKTARPKYGSKTNRNPQYPTSKRGIRGGSKTQQRVEDQY